MRFERFVARRYLKSRRKQSFISIISLISVGGVSLGIATVILVVSVMNGFEQALKDKLLANEAHVFVRSMNGFFKNYDQMIQQIKQVDDVVAASPVIYSQLALQPKGSKKIEGTIYVKGIDLKQEDSVTGFSEYVIGSVDFDDPKLISAAQEKLSKRETLKGGIILGYNVAGQKGLFTGDIIRLISKMEPNPANPSTFFADVSNYVVVGLYQSGLHTYDNAFGFVSLLAAQDLYNRSGQANLIQVKASAPEIAETVAKRIREQVKFPGGGLKGVPLTDTWMKQYAPLFEAMKLEKIVTLIIEALIVLVAAFNIASTLIMMVMEKTRDIGILRALGASKRQISKIFISQGILIGILGSMIGTVLGIGLCFLLDLENNRPSYWLSLTIILPVALQVWMAITRSTKPVRSTALINGQEDNFVSKIGIPIFWVLIVTFVLYCVVRPIQIDSRVYQLSQLAVEIDWVYVLFINFLSFFICLGATLYPAWQSSNLVPVEALRYE